LVLNVRGDARFRVGKDFTDGQNPTEVEVSITCNTGLPLQQTQTISETQDVVFVVESFDPGALDCTVSEDALTGYDTSYSASGDSDNSDEPQGCVFTDVAAGDDNACLITNAPAPVDVVITKEWVFEGSTETDVDTHYELTLHCDAEIVGGNDSFSGVGPDTFTAQVIPGYPASHCYVDEHVYDDAVEVDNGCAELVVSAGSGDECTITNTVFFEGIPALNPYGLAVLALLTLGMGFVVMRRIA
jgi:hypothetical protein